MSALTTERLTLIPFTLEMVQAAMHDRSALARLIGARVHPDWPLPDLAEALPIFATIFAQHPEASERHRLMLHTAEQMLIGDLGFRQVSAAEWELGYSVVSAYRRQGYMIEAARALVDWAFSQPAVQHISAECLPHNIGSKRVLEKLGMQQLLAEGDLLKWELQRSSWQATASS